jgi:pimeloyl-ACP methyl ester carboxylesterase
MNESRERFLTIILCVLVSGVAALGQTNAPAKTTIATPTGKTPVIIIPGLTGSDLVNGRTGEEVWFNSHRSREDDIRLPISGDLAQNRDNLVAKDIIRSVRFFKFLPETEIYERLIDALRTRGGYREAKWNSASRGDAKDTFYVFPYDWRRDNVENARLLIRRIEMLKRRLGQPNLKFNIVAHSMGGLIARYAAMYGNADLPAGPPQPTWAGAKHFDKIFLLGTPNEGSISALSSLLNGFSYVGATGINLPFIQDITRFDVFTIPSAYQLLPHDGAFTAYDENLKPIPIDIYDPAEWEKYDWAVWKDEAFTKKFDANEQKYAKPFFIAALARAKQFQLALDATSNTKPPVTFYLMGADCKETPTAIVLIRDEKKNRWETRFKADGFTRSNGEKVKDTDLKPLLFGVGDSVVTKASLSGVTLMNGSKPFPIAAELYQCVGHNKLATSPEVQDKLFTYLNTALPAAAP